MLKSAIELLFVENVVDRLAGGIRLMRFHRHGRQKGGGHGAGLWPFTLKLDGRFPVEVFEE